MAKLGDAFLSIFLDKNARAALKQRKAAPPPAQQPVAGEPVQQPVAAEEAPPHPAPEEVHARLEEAARTVGQPKSNARDQLIQQALRTRAEKAKMLDDLPDELRLKLQVMAVKSFMRGGNQ